MSLIANAAHAQVNPGAIDSEIRRQQERIERQVEPPREQGAPVVGPQRAPEVILREGGPKFTLRAVTFDKSKFLTPAELQALAKPYVGRQANFADLQKLVAAINALYQSRGIVTGIATLPPQKIDSGIVHIKLTEGRLGKLTFTGNVQTSAAYIKERISLPAPGEVVDVPRIGRDITWFNRTNDVQIRALLSPGTTFGLTDLQMAVTEPAVNTWQIFTDNQSTQSTGRYQGGSFYRRHGLFGVDDRLTFYGTYSQGQLNGNLAYNFPVNRWGGRLGLSYSRGKIKIVQGAFAALDVTGSSQSGSINFTQPFWVDEAWLLQATFAGSRSNSVTEFSGVTITDDTSDKETVGLSIAKFDSNHYITVAPSFNYVQSHSDVLDRDRRFYTFSGTGTALARLPESFSVSLLGAWQYAWEDLLPGDQLFQLGGPTTVRGYPTGAVSGDSGYYINFELHRNFTGIAQGLDVYAFFDHGQVFSTDPSVRSLHSVGFGLSLQLIRALTIEASIGFPLIEVVPNQAKHQLYARAVFRPLLFN